MILRKAIVSGIAAVALAAVPSDTMMTPERNCGEYKLSNIIEQQSQKSIGGKCFHYYGNDSKQELLIYEPKPGHPNIGTLTEIVLDHQTGEIEISRHAVVDLRKGPSPDDTKYEYIHQIPIGEIEKSFLRLLFEKYMIGVPTERKV